MDDSTETRYELWRTHWHPAARPWGRLNFQERGIWVNQIEVLHVRRIARQTATAMARFQLGVGAAVVAISGLGLWFYLEVMK